jgi:hypothetical protein
MCADHHHQSPSPGLRVALRNNITNWNQPLPFHVKVSKLVRNLWIRVVTRSTCCGHAGEPGC